MLTDFSAFYKYFLVYCLLRTSLHAQMFEKAQRDSSETKKLLLCVLIFVFTKLSLLSLFERYHSHKLSLPIMTNS